MRKNSAFRVILGGIVMISAVLLRFLYLDRIPLGLHIDEAGLGLNAWSIAYFGTDRYGNAMPLLPVNFYGEQSAFYTYFCAFFVRLMGLNMWSLRLPGAVMGAAAVVFGALIMKAVWGEKGFLAGALLLGFCPYFIMNCRFALDCNAMLGMFTIALYALAKLLGKAEAEPEGRFYLLFALTGVLFGLVLYTYIIAAVAISLFCVLFGIFYLFCRKEGRFLRFKQLMLMAFPMVILAVPLILAVCVIHFDMEPVVTPFFTIPKTAVNRTEEIAFSLAALPEKARRLLHVLTSDGKYGSSDRYWTMYPWSVPFVAAGGIHSLSVTAGDCRRRRLPGVHALMVFAAVSEAVLFLLCGQYNYHINGIFAALGFFCADGIFLALHWAAGRGNRVKKACAAALVLLYALSFAGFAGEYYAADTAEAYQVYGGVREALNLLDDEQKKRDIYILDECSEIYFLSNPLPPSEFAAACDELGYLKDFGNLHFHLPEAYDERDIVICNRSSGSCRNLSVPGRPGYPYSVLETEHYAVFYHAE